MNADTVTTVQFAVRYGDGEVEGEWDNQREADEFIEAMRRSIAHYRWNPEDYEPMETVTRTIVTLHRETPWTSVATPAPSVEARDDH